MKKLTTGFIVPLLLLVFVSSCKKEPDDTTPTSTFIKETNITIGDDLFKESSGQSSCGLRTYNNINGSICRLVTELESGSLDYLEPSKLMIQVYGVLKKGSYVITSDNCYSETYDAWVYYVSESDPNDKYKALSGKVYTSEGYDEVDKVSFTSASFSNVTFEHISNGSTFIMSGRVRCE